MAKYKRTAKINTPMCFALVLLCLTMISVHMTGGLYAKYITTASNGDSARVVGFDALTLTETGDFYEDNKLMIIPGVDLTKKAMVTFAGSEVATYVFVEVVPTGWKAAEDNKSFSITMNSKILMQWSVASSWTFLTSANGAYIYYCELNPNEVLNSADIIAANGKISVSNQITKSEISAMTGICIKLRAMVVQASGFESPQEAWDSIAVKEG